MTRKRKRNGWIGSLREVTYYLSVMEADRVNGEFKIGGERPTVGSGDEIVIPDGTVYYVDGKPKNLAAGLAGTSYGVGVKVYNPASVEYLERFSSEELERMPRLAVGQAEDLRYDDGKHRWWLDRVGPESGATHRIAVEELLPTGIWRTVHEYEPYGSANPKTGQRTTMARKKSRGKACPRGKIKRKGYTRKGYRRKDGTYVKPSRVPASCIEDRGAPGKGPKVIEITEPGKLGGKGFLKKSAIARRRLLAKCVRGDGYRGCLSSLNALAVYGKREFSKADLRKIEADRNWLVEKYGGPGSFKRSANSIKRLKNRLMNG